MIYLMLHGQLAYLLKYDTAQGRFDRDIKVVDGNVSG